MSITTPYSLELARDEDAISAVEGNTPDVVAGKMKIFLGANVLPSRPQTYQGSLERCFRELLFALRPDRTGVADVSASGHWQAASAGNITVAPGILAIGDDDVAVVLAANFAEPGATHFAEETFKQLTEVLRENTADN